VRQTSIAQVKPGDDPCRECFPDRAAADEGDGWILNGTASSWPEPLAVDDLRHDPQYPQWLDRP
jgi:hypothetical protein